MPPNRLAAETSPYLLQHAGNPVDWFPWGDEAFASARLRDVPVLLSVGYAACHWCHVMAHESFEDPDAAALMNEWFVNVKVDREERPDVDAVYMDAVQALTGHGGWPMTVFCTPDGVPFLGGTYFPPQDRHGMPSFKRVLASVRELWTTRRADLLDQGADLVRRIAASVPPASNEPLTSSLVSAAARRIASNYDATHGGFGGAPKFPQAPILEFGLRADRHTGDLREPLEHTFRAMAFGGIYDQLGGGFHRYSVDAAWLVPHFEKMLYDQAQLARVYLHAWQAYGDPLYRRICDETLGYLLRDMLDPSGGFHSSEDADSEGEEGRFYVWDHADVAPEARAYYGVTPEGNFEGRSILTAAGPEPPSGIRSALLERRERRVRPGRDDKIIASWNGLAIAAFAEAGAAFRRPDLLEAARTAAAFILDRMRAPDGRLLHTWRAGESKVTGLLEDVAYVTDGLIELWQATFEPRWLEAALGLAEHTVEAFAGPAGGFYLTASDHERLVVRQMDVIESATPSPAAVMTTALQRLAVLMDRPDLRSAAVDALRSVRIYMDRAPQAVPTWLGALDLYLSTPVEVAFTGDLASADGLDLRGVVTARFLPNRVVAGASAEDPFLDRVALLRDKPRDGRATAYVCERYVCRRPTSDPEELAAQLG